VLLVLLLVVLALWYLLVAARAALLFVGETLFAGSTPLPLDVRLGPLVLVVAALGAVYWSIRTSGGLFGGAGWARISAILLAFFAVPMGYPTDLAVAIVVTFLLFLLPSVRAFFR
jgi:hypothetical protein